jgi:hypothetical protein
VGRLNAITTGPRQEDARIHKIHKDDHTEEVLYITYAGTLEEHLLEILKEKRATLDSGDGVSRFARGGLCRPLEAGREPREERHPETP